MSSITRIPRASTFTFAVVLGLLATACGIEGNGDVVDEQRHVEEFAAVEVQGSIELEVNVVPSATRVSVEVTTDSNLQQYVDAYVVGDLLRIDVTNDISPTRGVVVRVNTPTLEGLHADGSTLVDVAGIDTGGSRLRVDGSSNVVMDGAADEWIADVRGSSHIVARIAGASLADIALDGSSDLKLAGSADELAIEARGSSRVDARDLRSDDVRIDASGSSSIEVCAFGSLDVQASGSTFVRYGCSPDSVVTDVRDSATVR